MAISLTELPLTPSQRSFLSFLSQYCHQEKISEEITDMTDVYAIAVTQCVVGMIYKQTRDNIIFHKGFLEEMFYNVNREVMFHDIIRAFEKEHIRCLCFKGSVLRNKYPDPALRSMGDIDLFIDKENHLKVDGIMQELGYQKIIDHHAVWTYYLDDFIVEIHNQLFYESLANAFDYRTYFNERIWQHAHHKEIFSCRSPCLYAPDDDMHFLYLMTHTAKHLLNSGVGFRPFLDMYFLVKNSHLNWSFINSELKRLQLYDFTCTCFALCEIWFNVSMPIHGKLEQPFVAEVTRKMFADGIFGFENANNDIGHLSKEMTRQTNSYVVNAGNMMLKKLFPSYRDMQLISYYAFVDGRPYLLPLAWVYRWFYCLVKKRRHGIKLLIMPLKEHQRIKQRERFMKTFGL